MGSALQCEWPKCRFGERAMTAASDWPSPGFATGVGQSDTHAFILSDKKANLHPAAGTDYDTIGGPEIAVLAMAPQQVAKR